MYLANKNKNTSTTPAGKRNPKLYILTLCPPRGHQGSSQLVDQNSTAQGALLPKPAYVFPLNKPQQSVRICISSYAIIYIDLICFLIFQDYSIMDPFPVPLLIIGAKYDIFQVFSLNIYIFVFNLYEIRNLTISVFNVYSRNLLNKQAHKKRKIHQ